MCTWTPSCGTLAEHLPVVGGREPAQSVFQKDPDGAGGGLGRLEHPETGYLWGKIYISRLQLPPAPALGQASVDEPPPSRTGEGGRRMGWC